MLGVNDNQSTSGSTGHPSMLDNVTPQDFQTQPTNDNSAGAQQVPAPQQPVPQYMSTQPQNTVYQAPAQSQTSPSDVPDTSASTSFNPFNQDPIGMSSTPQEPPATENQTKEELISDFTNGTSTTPLDDVADSTSTSQTPAIDLNKLASMKQQALAHLEPLADKLDGTPEETFRTTMMMIQANDNHPLLEKALEAAKKIEDDKVRDQAMLDIINDVNYFSQNSDNL